MDFKTVSGDLITIGAGSGTKWQWLKKGDTPTEGFVEPLVDSLTTALACGFNHMDTAEMYTTLPEVGEALRRSGKPRESVWITDKYYPGGYATQGPFSSGPAESISQSLERIGSLYLDLYLLHTPFFDPLTSGVGLTIKQIWQELERAVQEGKVRYIGVSNFSAKRLAALLEYAEIKPVVNQIEFHPFLQAQSPGIVEFCREQGIKIEAYSSLSPLFRDASGALDTVLEGIGQKHAKTKAQVLLRWVLQQGHLPITTSSKEQRCREALEVHLFALDPIDMETITTEGQKHYFRAFFEEEFSREE